MDNCTENQLLVMKETETMRSLISIWRRSQHLALICVCLFLNGLEKNVKRIESSIDSLSNEERRVIFK